MQHASPSVAVLCPSSPASDKHGKFLTMKQAEESQGKFGRRQATGRSANTAAGGDVSAAVFVHTLQLRTAQHPAAAAPPLRSVPYSLLRPAQDTGTPRTGRLRIVPTIIATGDSDALRAPSHARATTTSDSACDSPLFLLRQPASGLPPPVILL